VISPFAKPGYVSHAHTSIASDIKTFDLIFGLPYLNQFDAAAPTWRIHHRSAGLHTLRRAASDLRIFDPAKVREPGLDLKAHPGTRLTTPDDSPRSARARARLTPPAVMNARPKLGACRR